MGKGDNYDRKAYDKTYFKTSPVILCVKNVKHP